MMGGGELYLCGFLVVTRFFLDLGKKQKKKNTPCNSTGPLNLLFCKNKDGIEIKNEKGHLVLSFSRWNN